MTHKSDPNSNRAHRQADAMARLLDLQLHRYGWLIPMGERARQLNEDAKHD